MKPVIWPDSAALFLGNKEDEADSSDQEPLLEFTNKELFRRLHISHRACPGIVGRYKFETQIVITDYSLQAPSSSSSTNEEEIIFRIHQRSNAIRLEKDLVACRDALFASTLAGLPPPHNSQLTEILPSEAVSSFVNPTSLAHIHPYVERVVENIITCRFLQDSLKLFWWRVLGPFGAIVLLNEDTGRILVVPSEKNSFLGAAIAVFKLLAILRCCASLVAEDSVQRKLHKLPGSLFVEPDEQYIDLLNESYVGSRETNGNEYTYEEEMAIIQEWAAEAKASPWLTDYVLRFNNIKHSQVKMLRYSIDLDVAPNNAAIAIHAHMYEPLSRDGQAFPLCSIRFPLDKSDTHTLLQLRISFTKALWFLRKVFAVHAR